MHVVGFVRGFLYGRSGLSQMRLERRVDSPSLVGIYVSKTNFCSMVNPGGLVFPSFKGRLANAIAGSANLTYILVCNNLKCLIIGKWKMTRSDNKDFSDMILGNW